MKKSKKERLTELLDMPKEVILDLPKLTLYSNNQLTIENYSGILEYTSEHIRLKTADKTVAVSGSNLELRTITDIDVLIEGDISKIEYI
ncbi:MAG: YabP family protein [Firmicutes bacterium ADurb.Bin193]|nr:MAG: YabP family protein [Firmicutes bacterium ADurb.Bin193]